MNLRFVFASLVLSVILIFPDTPATAAPAYPPEIGQDVEGFQDGFNSSNRKSEWTPIGDAGDIYIQENGILKIGTGPGNANHLALQMSYNDSTQEILARIKVIETEWGDLSRGGVGLAINPGDSLSLNFHFRYMDIPTQLNPGVNPYLDEGNPLQNQVTPAGTAGNHMEFLNDTVTWGPELQFPWHTNVFYWLRMRHEIDSNGGTADVFAKIWKADGQTPEPDAWQVTWDYTPNTPARIGLAGLTGGSINGKMNLECDYVLIKAAGLPAIKVGAPEIMEVVPSDGETSHPSEQGIRFRVVAPFELDRVEMLLDGVDRSAELQSTGTGAEKEFVFLGLQPEKNYQCRIRAVATGGAVSQHDFSFGTFPPVTELRLIDPRLDGPNSTFAYVPLPGRIHTVEFRESLGSGAWSPAANISQTPQGNQIRVVNLTPNILGFYRVIAD